MAIMRLLVVGCADIARCALPRWLGCYAVTALLRKSGPASAAPGVHQAVGDPDEPRSFARLAGAADLVVHAAPPTESGLQDLRTRSLLAALGRMQDPRRMARNGGAMVPQRLATISTVYGDCHAECVDESHPTNPLTGRAARRSVNRRRKTDFEMRLRLPMLYAGVPAVALS